MLNERRVAQLFTAGYLRHVRVAEDPEPQEATEGQEGSTTATEGQEGQDGASEGQEGSQEATEGQEAAQEPTDDPRIVHLGGGWYDVLGPNGEPVNEKGLREDDAVALLAGLKAQEEGAAA